MRGSLLLAPLLALMLAPAAQAALLHWPLPSDSLERNGEPQRLTAHTVIPRRKASIAPMPDRGFHPKAALGLKRVYSSTPTDVLRYHNDNYPTGWNKSETDLTPATVGSASFGQLTTLNVDGNVIAQPLMVSNFQMPDSTTHNVLIVVTGHDTIYAYDAQTYAVLWQRSMGKAQSSDDVSCNDVVPEYGISSTPVIVRNGNAATIYLVAATEPAPFSFHTKIHALDLGTGADVTPAVEVKPQASLSTGGVIHFDPQNQWSRASLAFNNGSIYVGIGSHCDRNAGSISGWVLRYDTNLSLTGKFNTIEASAGYELSSVWMAGYSPAIDPNGNLYAVTGNGNYNLGRGMKGYGESVISLTSDIKKTPIGTFTPSNFQNLNENDTDFGSGGAMLIPVRPGQVAPPLLVAMGKASTLYLLDSTHLNGLEGHNGYQALQKFQIGNGCWCGAAYYVGPGSGANAGIVYYQADGDVLRSFRVGTGAAPRLVPLATGTTGAGYGGSFPVVSSNGSARNTGVVWLIRRGNTEQLEAYDALSLGDPLFAANAGSWNTGGPFLSPLVANGRVYVPAYQTVTVFGLTD
jgi:hypothetical protein